jgi:fermentation-respiration switch protein FrsA (DUF1100 family)
MLRRFMIALVGIFLILFVSVFFLVKFLEGSAVFFPGKTIHTTPSQAGLPYEDLYLITSDGTKINAWLVKNSVTASTIIFAHGNAGTMSERIMKIKFWHDLGLNVLIFDYRGYGHSEGHPTEKGIYLDAQAAYDYLQRRGDIDHNRIIAYGASLGGTVMIDLATKRKLAALIVESSLTSAKDMAQRLYPMLPSFLMSIKFDSISKIDKITIPKLFLHSREDRVVPFSMGQKLYETAADPKSFLLIYGGHNDGGSINDPRVREGFKKFLQTYSL